MGLAAAATTNPGSTPKYGLVYDLGTGRWQSAQQFNQFVRDVIPATQPQTVAAAKALAEQKEHAKELEKARNFQEHGLYMTNKGMGEGQHGLGNEIETSFKKVGNILGQGVSFIAAGPGGPDQEDLYKKYAKKGGLLSEEEFNEFDDETRRVLYIKANAKEHLQEGLEIPGVSPVLHGLEKSYRGLIAGTEMVHMQSQSLLHGRAPVEFLSGSKWQEAWREAQGESLGNAVLNTILDPFTNDETLDRWKRDNPWYQMSSFGTEFVVAWYADPLVLGLKGAGATSRLARMEMPLREQSPLGVGLRQRMSGQPVTVRNPITRAVVNVQGMRMEASQARIRDYALAVSAPEFVRSMPMFGVKARTSDGGAGGFALHWAINNKAAANEILNSPKMKADLDPEGMIGPRLAEADETLDVEDLTYRLMYGDDPQAWALLNKLQKVTPAELNDVAPGSQTLFDAVNATTTKNTVLQQEVDDLIREADELGTGTPSRFHRWEVHTSLADKTRQLDETTSALHKYEGYQSWLDLLTVKASPSISRIQGPSKARWSQVRRTENGDGRETRGLFRDNQYGHAHGFFRMPKGLFNSRANTIEIHSLESGFMSINRQFDQYEHHFGYAPEGVRDSYLERYAAAKDPYERYKIAHELEETHLVSGIAHRFGIEEDTARAIVNKINDERNRSIRGILTGEGQIYRTAPTIKDRLGLGHEDSTMELVGWSDDHKVATVNIMHGKFKQTYEVPEEALFERVAPQDVTQTPNYYKPLDTRRLFYQLKHDKSMLEELNAGFVRRDAAAIAEAGEKIGTLFNSLWKPAALFRLGWPMRVLMDEGARAMAIYGPMYWLTGPGMEAVYHSARNVLPATADAVARHRHGKLGTDMGPGPVTQGQKAAPNQFVRDAEVNTSVVVPDVFWDKVNPARAEKIGAHVRVQADWDRAVNKMNWWRDVGLNRLLALEERTPAQERALQHGLHSSVDYTKEPIHPMRKIAQGHINREAYAPPGDKKVGAPGIYDPATGNQIRQGYVVPIAPGQDLGIHGVPNVSIPRLTAWYAQNAEMLSRQGMRIVVDRDGRVAIGRVFRSNEFHKANQYHQYVSDTHPDVEMWNLGKNKSYRVQEADELSPIAEATYRRFAGEELVARQTGTVPADPAPAGAEAFHGSADGLPDDLLPRDQVPIYNGRMIGDGLYTTLDEGIAGSYGSAHTIYVIKGTKSGRTYKTFDLDTPFQPYFDDLRAWAQENNVDMGWMNTVEEAVGPASRYNTTASHASGEGTWANLYENLGMEPGAQRILHRYLEERHSAGALTHKGGTTHGHPHQVYVWLHPEDIVIKPLYSGTGKYMPVEEWFSHPQSVENVMPESRIIRKGNRNPMVRELRGIGRQLEDDFDNLSGFEIERLVQREKVLMDALGLRRSVSADGIPYVSGKVNQLLPNRYAVVDEGKFRRTVDEARAEDAARSQAAAANGEQRAREVESQDFGDIGDFDFQIDSPVSWLFNKIRTRHEQGIKKKKVTTSDGEKFYVDGAFAGHQGKLFRSLTASNGALDVLSEGHGGGTSLARRQSEGYKVYAPPQFSERAVTDFKSRDHKRAAHYFHVYADTINDHVGNSPVMQRMLRGGDDDELIRFLDETPEGARIKAEVKPEHMPTGVWVDDMRSVLNYYVPSKKLQRLLAKGRLKPSDFRKNVADEDLPHIYGPDLEVLDRRRKFSEFLSDGADKVWSGLGGMPIDRLSRNPFAQAAYNAKMRSLVARTDSKWMNQEMIDHYRKVSHTHAMNEVKKGLYTLSDGTNFNDALRFVAPFWGAQYEAITKWLRIVSDRPETVGRFFAGQRAVQKNFLVQDADGNEVNRNGGYHPTDRVILQVPKFLQRKLFGDLPIPAKMNPSLEYMGQVGIPIGSANTVLQGELPLLPGFGPLMTLPADFFMRKMSDSYNVENDDNFFYRWLFPVGRPRSKNEVGRIFEQISPGWGKRFAQSGGAEDDPARINMQMQLGREMVTKAREQGKPEPTNEDIQKAADHMWATRILSGMVQPFQTQYLPDHQYWVDAAHRYQKEYGQDWWDKYIDDFGEEAAIYATSSSNSVGVPPTSQGMEEWSENKKLIQKYPAWASAIISPQAYMDDFSSDSYGAQFNITLGPGDTRHLRETTSLQDRLYTDPESRLGWREFRKVNAAIEAELYARGLTNIQSSRAQDLVQIKRAAIADLIQKYPAWGHDYGLQQDSIYAQVEDLKEISVNKAFNKRPDMQGVRQYLAIRQQVVDSLDAYGVQGGSRSLQAQENSDLRGWFYDQVGQLVLANPAFAEFYSRYLDNDTLDQGGGGF